VGPVSPASERRTAALAFAAYAALTVVFTWPMAANLLLLEPGDHAFFSWEIAWEVRALLTQPGQLPHANIFHPLRHALGLDEPILGTTVLVLPLGLFTTDPAVLGNLARLLTWAVSGLTTFLLARELGCARGVAFFAGAAFAFSPIRTDQVAHLSTLGTQWMPCVVLFLVRFTRGGRLRDALLAGASFAAAAYACGYHGVIGLAVLPPVALLLVWGRFGLLPRAAAGAALAVLLLLPLRALHEKALEPLRYERNTTETQLYAASLETFLATSAWNRVWGPSTRGLRSATNNLFPGLVPLALAAAGAAVLARRRQRPSREVMALALLGILAALVALGPEVRWFGTRLGPGPFALLRDLELFRMVRVPARAGAWLALALALLAARGLQRVGASRPAVGAATGLLLLESCIAPIPMPDWVKVYGTRWPTPPVYEWLAAQPPGTSVLELPMVEDWAVLDQAPWHESTYMLWSTRHWQPLANGYAGTEPPAYRQLRGFVRRFPAPDAREALRARGIRYVVVHRAGYGPNRWAGLRERMAAEGSSLRTVATFGDDTVYELAD
jgi:hypothetical protein